MASLKPRDSKGKIDLSKLTLPEFLKSITESRLSQGKSVEHFSFNKLRCRVLTKNDKVLEGTKGILYWMIRDCRVQDNWAMLFAQKLALKNKLPLFVCFTIFEAHHLYPTKRHQSFLIKGLRQVQKESQGFNIPFYLLNASPKDLAEIVAKNNIGAVVCDFNPLKKAKEWVEKLLEQLPDNVPLVQVDAHNIVPAWTASSKQEHMARTIRGKINSKLAEFLTGLPSILKMNCLDGIDIKKYEVQDFDEALGMIKTTWDVDKVPDIKAGSEAGLENLHSFLVNRLKYYGVSSNDPSKNHTSNVSFWLNFGQISAQRVALEAKSLEALYKDQVEKYLEELIVRRELAENYCFYNENYDNLKGAADWAQNTLLAHKNDKRTYLYTREQFEKGQTHDPIWNAAQLQLLKEGKIHGYMRMYWCKKVLEWTESPEQALEYALWLNDTFALDGTDPNGFVGVMWSICGVHDQGWKEREIFGKIRFMVDYSLRRKYDIDAYCARYGVVGKSDKKPKKGVKRKAS